MSGRFVNFSQYLAANEDNAKRAADAVGDSVDRYATATQDATSSLRTDVQTGKAPSGAESSLYPGAAAATQRATQATANTGTAGGLQYELDASGVKGGTLGGERFNSGLAGTVGRERYAAQRSRYAGLQDALSGEAKRTPLVNAPVRPREEKKVRVPAPAPVAQTITAHPDSGNFGGYWDKETGEAEGAAALGKEVERYNPVSWLWGQFDRDFAARREKALRNPPPRRP